jgi:hypothetical protein
MEPIMCTPQMTITKMAITGKIGLKNCTQRLFSPLSYQHFYQSTPSSYSQFDMALDPIHGQYHARLQPINIASKNNKYSS